MSNAAQKQSPPIKKRLGEQLVDVGLLSQDQLKIALIEQSERNKPLGEILVSLGFLSDEVIRDVLSNNLGQDSVDLNNYEVKPEILDMLGAKFCRQLKVVPLTQEGNAFYVAMSDILDLAKIDRISAKLGSNLNIKPLIASNNQIEDALDRLFGFDLSIDSILVEIENENEEFIEYHGEDAEYSHPVVRLVDAILSDAVKQSSSDIHFEPEKGFLRVRYRIDGVLRQVRSLHSKYWPAINVRLKVMSEMNIAESHVSQDGRISRKVGSREIDFRVATQPTIYGENIVLRVLDKSQGIIELEKMGLAEDVISTIHLIMSRPEGIILVTGPTGSGKTTTLYSMLSAINEESINIMTLEDPVEYPMQMIRQTSITNAKMTFSAGIKALMRQDPDVILVGEIRDKDTAEQAFRAAMTGHQVLSTLHTNSAIGALTRLYDLGLVPEILSSNISGVIGQRLLRKLCGSCKELYKPNDVEKKLLNCENQDVEIYRPVGCKACDMRGYKGRIPVLEVLRVDRNLDELIERKAGYAEIEKRAVENGFTSLADRAVEQVVLGNTSLEEAVRNVDMTSRIKEV